jgi:tetratricopeptide (TPR) repeat protein
MRGGLPLAPIGAYRRADFRYLLGVVNRYLTPATSVAFRFLALCPQSLLIVNNQFKSMTYFFFKARSHYRPHFTRDNCVAKGTNKGPRAHPEKLIFFLLILIPLPSTAIFADEVYSKNRQGNNLYQKGNYEEALKKYDDALLVAPTDTLLKMNRGSTLYRLNRLDEADSAYAGAISVKNKWKRADAHYNLGNIQFKEGDMLMQSGGQGASEKYKSALQNYIAALDLRPSDKDAKWNIELTQRRIKQQEQQQKNQDKQDKNKDKQDKKQDQNKQNQNQDKNNKQDKDKNQNDQNNKDRNKQDQQNQNSGNDKQQQQPPKPQPQDSKDAMKKKEAERIIAQFADDADTLNKPPKKQGFGLRMHKPEKDW